MRTLEQSLAHAVTDYDRKQQVKAAKARNGYYNPYALGHYLGACEKVCAIVNEGGELQTALRLGFILASPLFKAVEKVLLTDGHLEPEHAIYRKGK